MKTYNILIISNTIKTNELIHIFNKNIIGIIKNKIKYFISVETTNFIIYHTSKYFNNYISTKI